MLNKYLTFINNFLKMIKLIHWGEDYAKILVNGFEYEVSQRFVYDCRNEDILEISDDIDSIELLKYFKENFNK